MKTQINNNFLKFTEIKCTVDTYLCHLCIVKHLKPCTKLATQVPNVCLDDLSLEPNLSFFSLCHFEQLNHYESLRLFHTMYTCTLRI